MSHFPQLPGAAERFRGPHGRHLHGPGAPGAADSVFGFRRGLGVPSSDRGGSNPLGGGAGTKRDPERTIQSPKSLHVIHIG